MTASLVTGLLVTLIVWSVSQVRSVRWQSLLYSLPLPITVVLATTDVRVDGGQLLGVAALVLFFAVVSVLHLRLGWHIAAADAAGVLTYILLGRLIAWWGPIPFLPTLLVVSLAWLVATSLAGTADGAPAERQPYAGTVARFGIVLGASMLTVALGRVLQGLIVTFPYSGVLVAVEVRRDLDSFTRGFLRVSIGLVAFLVGFELAQDGNRWIALGAGWLAFACCTVLLRLMPLLERHGIQLRRIHNRRSPGGEPRS